VVIYLEQAVLDERVHEALFSDAAIMLGEMHGAILTSTHIMDKERWIPTKSGFGSFETTNFQWRIACQPMGLELLWSAVASNSAPHALDSHSGRKLVFARRPFYRLAFLLRKKIHL
jgi:hypothetical protein